MVQMPPGLAGRLVGSQYWLPVLAPCIGSRYWLLVLALRVLAPGVGSYSEAATIRNANKELRGSKKDKKHPKSNRNHTKIIQQSIKNKELKVH